MEPKVLYEDGYILVLDKPSGMMVHSDGRSKAPTLTDWINENYPNLKEVGEEQILQNGKKIKRPGIVHRLDKETSGVIVIAKTKEVFEFLKDQFKNRKVEKIYNAIVWGNFSPDKIEGVIKTPIGRSASDFRKWSAERGAKGELREAVTEYKVLAQGYVEGALPSEQKGTFYSVAYLEVRPRTGRTHQIRVHLKSISHPVICDRLYGSKKSSEMRNASYGKNLGFDRLALHALSIKLELPNHTYIRVESPLPKEFGDIKEFLKNNYKLIR